MEAVQVSKTIPMNIIFPIKDDKVLLGTKTRKIGAGKINGWGGKVESGQTAEEAAARELSIESRLITKPEDFEKVGEVYFYIHKKDGSINLIYCDIFITRKFSGEPQDTEEMIHPTWFQVDKLPLSKMMIDASFWIPNVMSGDRMKWKIHLNENRTRILGSIHSERLELN